MSSDAQINANRHNAQSSTGPRTDEGKTASSRNALTLGLYTRQDYVRPEERDLYKEFCETMYDELSPASLLEESFVAEITGTTWRLRRCSAAEAELADYAPKDPLLDDATDKTRRSIERARASAHSILNRSINQLRKLQTERLARYHLNATGGEEGLADYKQVVKATNDYERAKHLHAKSRDLRANAAIQHAMHVPNLTDEELGLNCKPASAPFRRDPETPLASNCERSGLIPTESQSKPNAPGRAPCPCNSGKKFKNCCARTGPGWPETEAA